MEGQGENDELYPIAVLIDELKVWFCRATTYVTRLPRPNGLMLINES